MKTFYNSLMVSRGYFVICEKCDKDQIAFRKRTADKFYRLHAGMHRHPSKLHRVA